MTFTVADVKYLEPKLLKGWLTAGVTSSGGNFAVVDVRDSDYIGGHIKGCWHIPAAEIGRETPNILKRMQDQDIQTVVFHCMMSQQRGPASAMKFLRYLDEVADSSSVEESEKDFIDKVKVCVLSGGFDRWQSLYGPDKSVTESYAQDLWE